MASVTLFAQAGPDDAAMIERIKQKNLDIFAGVGVFIGNPQGSYRRGLDSVGITSSGVGFNINGGYYFDPVPIALAADFGMLFHRSQSKRFLVPAGPLFRDTVDYETSLNTIPFNVSARIQPNLFTWVFPYAEGIVGATVTYGSYSVQQYNGSRSANRSESESDIAWQYGFGLGAMIKFADYIDLPNTLQRFYVDARMRYMWSGPQNITVFELNQNDGSYKTKSTNIANPEVIHFTIGVGIQF